MGNTEILHQHQKAQKNRFSEAETLFNSLVFGEELSLRHQVQDLSNSLLTIVFIVTCEIC